MKTGQAAHTAGFTWFAEDAPKHQARMFVASAIMIGVGVAVFALSIRVRAEERPINAAVAVATLVLAVSATPAGAHNIPDASACVSIYWTGEEPCDLADHKGTVTRGWEARNICSETVELHWGDNADGSTIELYEAATPLRPGEVFGSHIACVDKPHLSWCADYEDEELKSLDGECE